MNKLFVSVIQMCSGSYKMTNLNKAEHLLKAALESTPTDDNFPHLVCLPEVFNFQNTAHPEEGYVAAEDIPGGPTFNWAHNMAKKYKIWLLAGSILEKPVEGQIKPFNTSFALNPEGELIAKYRKINLFQLNLENAPELCEPTYRQAGNDLITFETDWGKVGIAICFDLRFPEIFLKYREQKCDLIVLPSAFTYKTGQAHWEILCRARAIENQLFLIAPNQSTGSNCWGHSLIVSPWGEIINSLSSEDEGFMTSLIDLEELSRIREKLPMRKC